MNTRSIKIIFISYIAVISIGTMLLKLPISTTAPISWINALFTSTSATCVTGLIVQNTQYDFTLFGQIIIALLIQIGGFGYMSLVLLLAILIGKRLDFQDRMIVKENFDYPTVQGVIKFLIRVFKYVLVIELIGAMLLFSRFVFEYETTYAIWMSIFHSISAFNNAGFSLLETGLTPFRSDIAINLVITALVILGGVGYYVLIDLREVYKHKHKSLSLHSKIVVIGTIFLLISGVLMVLSLEWNNPKTLGELSFFEKLLSSWFTSVNYRTSGFNTLDIGSFKDSTLFFSTLFMVIGGAPGGTAGGVKITTVFVLILAAYFAIKNSKDVYIYKKSISSSTVFKALSIVMISSFYIWLSLIVVVENENLDFSKILFEVTSAFGTVGLSTGDGGSLSASALFGDVSKVVIILLMLMGRVGVLAFTIALIGAKSKNKIKYPEGKVLL